MSRSSISRISRRVPSGNEGLVLELTRAAGGFFDTTAAQCVRYRFVVDLASLGKEARTS